MTPRVPDIAKTFIDEQEESGSKSPVCRAYWDGPKPVGGPVGGWAIGPGMHGPDITQRSLWTRERVEKRFGELLDGVSQGICPNIVPELTDPQLAACESLAYNLADGIDEFNGSTLLKLLNAGNFSGAADEFPKWCHTKNAQGEEVVDSDLLERRKKEKALFLSGTAQTAQGDGPGEQPPVPPAPITARARGENATVTGRNNLSTWTAPPAPIGGKNKVNKVKNIWQHPVTTIAGLVGGAVLVAAHQPNWHTFLEAIAVAVLGAMAKES